MSTRHLCTRTLPVVVAVGLVITAPALADLAAGEAAFEAGNAREALGLLLPEAESGNARAQFLLGQLFSQGGEIARDASAAADWYRKAAEGDLADAQYQLGILYSVGFGTDKDLVEAYRWLRIAERGLGHDAATQFIQSFVGQMTDEQIAEAEDLVKQWDATAQSEPQIAETPTADAVDPPTEPEEPVPPPDPPAPEPPSPDPVPQVAVAVDEDEADRLEEPAPPPVAVTADTAQADATRRPSAGDQLAAVPPDDDGLPEPEPPPAEIIGEAVAALSCADVAVDPRAGGAWELAGVVETEEDARELVAALESALPEARIQAALQAVGRPVCAVAEFAGRFRDRSRLELVSVSGTTRFADGDTVIVDISLPPAAGFLYVDYFQLDGQVVHILPLPEAEALPTEPGATLRLGDGTLGFKLRVAAPFGQEMLTAFVVPEPLFEVARPLAEPADEYLAALAREAERLTGSAEGLLADTMLVTTAAE